MADDKERNGLVGNIHEGDGEDAGQEDQRREVEPLQLEHDQRMSAQKTSEGLKVIIVSSITFAVGVTVALIVTIYCAPPEVPPHGSVACEVARCSVVGTDILKKGGSAVDAAVATTFCVGVVHPFHAGIGGGAFVMVRQHKEQLSEAIDGREVATLAATDDMYADNADAQKTGGLSVGVPGELKALALAHSRHGKLPWKDLVMPAVDIAQNGFEVSKRFAEVLKDLDHSSFEDDNFDSFFFPRNGTWEAGDVMTNPVLADTLQIIAEQGADVFYNGSLAQQLVDELGDSTLLTLKDLAGYKAVVREPVSSLFFNHTVESFPAPGSGPILLLLLNIMEGFLHDAGKNRTQADKEAETKLNAHRLVEAIKFSYAQQPLLGDPDSAFNPDMKNTSLELVSKKLAELLRNKTDDEATHAADWYGNVVTPRDGQQTSHVSVIGPNEDHVAITSTINSAFGSQMLSSLGFILNNQMLDFDTDPQGSNRFNLIAPGKRPLSSMCPTLIHSRNRPCGLRVAVGGVNGTRIVSGVAQVVLNLLGRGDATMPLAEGIDAPRLHHPWVTDVLEYEEGYDPAVIEYLKSKGHNKTFEYPKGTCINMVNGVAKINETVTGHADSRTEGKADTY